MRQTGNLIKVKHADSCVNIICVNTTSTTFTRKKSRKTTHIERMHDCTHE